MREGSAPDGPTDVAGDVPAVTAGLDDGGLETRHVDFIAAIRQLPVENERLQEARLQAGPKTHDSAGDGVLESRRAELPAHIPWLKPELERVHA